MSVNRKLSFHLFISKCYSKYLDLEDFWWTYVTLPIRNRREKHREQRWLKRYGYPRYATWAPGEYLLKQSMEIFKAWLKEEWGEPPHFFCQTHNKRMYKEIQRFVFRAERYFKRIECDFPTTEFGEPDYEKRMLWREENCKLEAELYQDLAKILKKYGLLLWT